MKNETAVSTKTGAPWGWTARHRAQQIAIVGVTGAVGRELATLLVEAGHPLERIDGLARKYDKLEIGKKKIDVRPLESTSDASAFSGTDLAFLCTPSDISHALAPHLIEFGTRVIDLSSAHRLRPDVPLVIPEINGAELEKGSRLIANPNCTTAIAVLPLSVIERECGLEEVIVVSFQAASGAGNPGLATLAFESRESLGAKGTGSRPNSPFPATLALNVIPGVAAVDARGTSGEEQKIVDEMRRILDRPDLVVEATTTRVPVERCHSVAVHVRTRREFDLARLKQLLARSAGISVVDDPHGPRPRECAGLDPVFVGRIRAGTRGSRSLCFFAVGDQIRKGAALNAFQIAAALETDR